MTPEEIAEKEAATAAAKEVFETSLEGLSDEEKTLKRAEFEASNSQDPLKKELDRARKPRTEAEKAAFSLRKNAERARELGLDPSEILSDGSSEGKDKVVTVEMLEQREKDKAAKTAIALADEQIENETERELVKHHLESSIRPSGNPATDLANARAIVNSIKNKQIADEAVRRGDPNRHGSATGAPGNHEAQFTPTEEERRFMSAPFNMTKEDILKARPVSK